MQVCPQRSDVCFPACLSPWKTSDAAGILKTSTSHLNFAFSQTWRSITLWAMPSGAPRGLPCTTVEAWAGELSGSCREFNHCCVFTPWFPPQPCRGEVINGGFGLLLDGSEEAARRASLMLNWDVSNGVRRRHGKPTRERTRVTRFPAVCRWPAAAGRETPTLMRPSSAPWRRTGSCASPCPFRCRTSTCWTGPSRADGPRDASEARELLSRSCLMFEIKDQNYKTIKKEEYLIQA